VSNLSSTRSPLACSFPGEMPRLSNRGTPTGKRARLNQISRWCNGNSRESSPLPGSGDSSGNRTIPTSNPGLKTTITLHKDQVIVGVLREGKCEAEECFTNIRVL